jgi:hypothetical protein
MTMAAVAETTAEGAVVVVVMTVVAVVVERILVGATIVAGTGLTIVAAAEDAEAMTMLDHERRIVDGAGVAQMIPWPRARLGTGHENSIRRAHARGEPITSSRCVGSAGEAPMIQMPWMATVVGQIATVVSNLEMIAV